MLIQINGHANESLHLYIKCRWNDGAAGQCFDHCLMVRRCKFDSQLQQALLFYFVSVGVLSGASRFPHHQKQTVNYINQVVVWSKWQQLWTDHPSVLKILLYSDKVYLIILLHPACIALLIVHFSSDHFFDFLRSLQSITTDCYLTAHKRYRNWENSCLKGSHSLLLRRGTTPQQPKRVI